MSKQTRDFIINNSSLMKEWNWEKNNALNFFPDKLSEGSNKKVWWKCILCENEWQATIYNRALGHTGCPRCKRELHTSFPEQVILFYLSKVIHVESRFIIFGKEADIFIPKMNIAIEYEGYFFHNKSQKVKYDIDKEKSFNENNIKLIKIIEHNDKIDTYLTNNEIHCFADQKYHYMHDVLGLLFGMLNITPPIIDLENDYNDIMSQYITLAKKNSLLEQRPDLSKEWHPTKNGNLTPSNFQVSSSKYAWWICPKCGHEWQAKICNRSAGKGCPACNQYAVTSTNNLLFLFPDIAKEWHPTKNGSLKPDQVLPGSNKTVWWKDAHGNEWQSKISVRVIYKTNAPQLRGKHSTKNRINNKITIYGSLKQNYPNIVINWDYKKNSLNPDEYLASSHEKVWWRCPICNKEWLKEIRLEVRYPHKCKI